jgi:hypothetical protein
MPLAIKWVVGPALAVALCLSVLNTIAADQKGKNGQNNQKDNGQKNQKDDGQQNQNDDGDGKGKPKLGILKAGQGNGGLGALGNGVKPRGGILQPELVKPKPDNQNNQNDDGQQNQKDDGQKNQKNNGQKNQKGNGN